LLDGGEHREERWGRDLPNTTSRIGDCRSLEQDKVIKVPEMKLHPHVQRFVMHVAIEMHSSFDKQDSIH